MCGKNTGCGEKKADRLDMYYEDRTCHRENKKTNRRKRSGMCFLGIILIFYLLFLIRVILFRQVSIDNLAAAIGAGNRSISLIPAHSVVQMISSESIRFADGGKCGGECGSVSASRSAVSVVFSGFFCCGRYGGRKEKTE